MIASEKTVSTTLSAGGAMGPEIFLTVEQLAARLQLRPRRIYDLLKTGVIPGYKIGRQLRFRWSEVLAAVELNCRVNGDEIPQNEPADATYSERRFIT